MKLHISCFLQKCLSTREIVLNSPDKNVFETDRESPYTVMFHEAREANSNEAASVKM
jgi:hypothetical protein